MKILKFPEFSLSIDKNLYDFQAASECQSCDPSPITTEDDSMDLKCRETTTASGKKKMKCAAKCPKRHKLLGFGRAMNFICKCTGTVSLIYLKSLICIIKINLNL